MKNRNCLANCPALLRRALITLAAVGAPLASTGAQTLGDSRAYKQTSKGFFVTISAGAFYTIAGDNWYPDVGVGIGRDVWRRVAFEIGLAHAPLETPASRYGLGSDEVYFRTPIKSLTATARVTLPFAPILFVGAGAGVLRFDGSDDGVGTFTATTRMWILGIQHHISRRTFARIEGHSRVDRHPPFNGTNGEILGFLGVRF